MNVTVHSSYCHCHSFITLPPSNFCNPSHILKCNIQTSKASFMLGFYFPSMFLANMQFSQRQMQAIVFTHTKKKRKKKTCSFFQSAFFLFLHCHPVTVSALQTLHCRKSLKQHQHQGQLPVLTREKLSGLLFSKVPLIRKIMHQHCR